MCVQRLKNNPIYSQNLSSNQRLFVLLTIVSNSSLPQHFAISIIVTSPEPRTQIIPDYPTLKLPFIDDLHSALANF